MRLWLLVIGSLCLFGAALLWGMGDPWARATERSVADARAISAVQDRPDRVGFLLSQDPAVLKAIAWSPDGSVLYPGPKAYLPTRFDLSLEEVADLTRRTLGDAQPGWSRYDPEGTKLLFCQPNPRVCLIYDRDALEAALGMSLSATSRTAMGVLAVIGVLFLLANAFLMLRRNSAEPSEDHLVLLPDQHAARRGTLEVALTPRDFRLLAFLQTRQGAVVTKDELYDAGWGREFMPNSRALDQHMINLRKKLDPDKTRAPVIETVRGVGYRLLE